jgi:hypothetical protein
MMTAKLWISAAQTPHGSEYVLVAVVPETREDEHRYLAMVATEREGSAAALARWRPRARPG